MTNKQREIKFKVYENGIELYPNGIYHLVFPNMGGVYLEERREETTFGIFPGKLDIVQYTGLKDKNGKEIYEGDIVKYDDEICEVVWDDAAFLLVRKTDKPFTGWKFKWCEVIGNIYKNPELLKND